LRELFPVELKEMQTLDHHPEFQEWLRIVNWSSGVAALPTRVPAAALLGLVSDQATPPAEATPASQPFGT